MGIRKSRDGHAGVIDAHDPWISIEHTVECLGGRHLRDEADIRDARAVAMAEPAAFGMLGEQRFDRLQTRAEPMLDPGESMFVADLQHVREVVPNTRYYQRVESATLINANPRTQARAKGSAGNSGGSGCVSSRYSRIASDWNSLTPPSIKVGTTICGLITRYAAAN